MTAQLQGSRLSNITLAEQAAREIVRYIEQAELQPGDSLPAIQALAERFQVNRLVVREAFKSLEAKGIIAVTNGRRARVKAVDAEPLRGFFFHAATMDRSAMGEFMEIRKGLEIQGAKLAAVRRTPEQLAKMRSAVAAMRANLHDVDLFTENDVELHMLIAHATHNRLMVHLIDSIRDSMRATIWEGRQRRLTEEQLERIQDLHESLLTELERGDPEGAARAMELHFDEIAMSVGRPGSAGEE